MIRVFSSQISAEMLFF